MGQAWFRNPRNYIRECAELLVPLYAWDRGLALKHGIDVQRFTELHLPTAVQYRILMVGEQGTAELQRGRGMDDPVSVYPTWVYGENTFDELEKMLDEPVPGQEHRVVVTRYPPAHTNIGRGFIKALAKVQKDYPEAIVHLHGTYSYKYAFGMGFGAADVTPRDEAAQGKIFLPNGRKINYLESPKWNQWITLMGFTHGQLSVPRNRCLFSIKAAIWAAEYWDTDVAFRVERGGAVDPASPVHQIATVQTPVRGKPLPGDKFVCNACSLAQTCKYFRDGGVCTLPDAEPSDLAKLFGTRDSDRIIEGYGRFLEMQAERGVSAVQVENMEGELNPEATKILNSVMMHAGKLAKLVDPTLAAASATKVNVHIGLSGTEQITPQAIVARVVQELEAEGWDRQQITDQMIGERMAQMARRPRAIEAKSR